MIKDFSQELADEVAAYGAGRPKDREWCRFFWGSHGCSLPAEPAHTLHQCTTNELDEDGNVAEVYGCMEYDETRPADARVRAMNGDTWVDDDWEPYGDGWYMEPHTKETS